MPQTRQSPKIRELLRAIVETLVVMLFAGTVLDFLAVFVEILDDRLEGMHPGGVVLWMMELAPIGPWSAIFAMGIGIWHYLETADKAAKTRLSGALLLVLALASVGLYLVSMICRLHLLLDGDREVTALRVVNHLLLGVIIGTGIWRAARKNRSAAPVE